MKINDINRVNRINPYRNQPGVNYSSQSGKKNIGNDQLHISEEAIKLLDSQEKMQIDPARSEMVAKLQQSVSTGTYHVDAGKIAEKLAPWLYMKDKNL